MKRRKFLTAAIGGGVAGLAAPAVATSSPTIRWRLGSNAPQSLDTIYGTAKIMAGLVDRATNGQFKIEVFAEGEIVPAGGILDAVQNATLEMGHTASTFYIGKDVRLAFDTALPFGLTARQQIAWMYYGGGQALMQEVFDDYNIRVAPGGNSGAQMGGWFRKEVASLDDIKGLKMRIGGLSSQVLARLGAIPQQIPPGEIYPALEKGAIDAAEWIGPHDDEKLGLYKVAKYYYYPGFWEGNTQTSFYINKDKWASLPAEYQAILESAMGHAGQTMTAKYDADNPLALRRLLQSGAVLKAFPRDVLEAGYKTAFELYDEIAEKNPGFKKIYESWREFRSNALFWWPVAELSFEGFSASEARKKS